MYVHSKEKILAAMPSLDENAKLLAKGFTITTVEASTATEVKEKLRQTLLNIKQKYSKEGLKAEKEALEEALKELGAHQIEHHEIRSHVSTYCNNIRHFSNFYA